VSDRLCKCGCGNVENRQCFPRENEKYPMSWEGTG